MNKCEDLACFLAEIAPIPVKEQEMSGLANSSGTSFNNRSSSNSCSNSSSSSNNSSSSSYSLLSLLMLFGARYSILLTAHSP